MLASRVGGMGEIWLSTRMLNHFSMHDQSHGKLTYSPISLAILFQSLLNYNTSSNPMQHLKQKLTTELNKFKFGHQDRDANCPISTNRLLATDGQIFILEKYIKLGFVRLRVYTHHIKLNYNCNTEIDLLESQDTVYDLSISVYSQCSVEVTKHPNSPIICIAIRTPSALSPDHIFVSSFDQQLSFPTNFYKLQLSNAKLLKMIYLLPSQQHILVLDGSNRMAIYDVWNNLTTPANVVNLSQLNIRDSNDVALKSHIMSTLMDLLVSTLSGQIHQVSIHPLSLLLEGNQLVYSPKTKTNQHPNSIISFEVQLQPYLVLSHLDHSNIQLEILGTINEKLTVVGELTVSCSEIKKRRFPFAQALYRSSEMLIMLVGSKIIQLKFKADMEEGIEMVPRVLVEIQNCEGLITVSNLLGHLFIILSRNEKITIELIDLKVEELATELYNLQPQCEMDSSAVSTKFIKQRLASLENIRSIAQNTIRGAASLEQILQSGWKLTKMLRLQSCKCLSLSKTILSRIQRLDSLRYQQIGVTMSNLRQRVKGLQGKKAVVPTKQQGIKCEYGGIESALREMVSRGEDEEEYKSAVEEVRWQLRNLTMSARSDV